MIRLDVLFLSYDGNGADVALCACIGALHDLRFPGVTVTEEGEVVCTNGPRRGISVAAVPVAVTFALTGGVYVADPNSEEEGLSAGAVTLVQDSAGQVYGIHKPGGAPITPEDLARITADALIRTRVVEEALAEARSRADTDLFLPSK